MYVLTGRRQTLSRFALVKATSILDALI